MLFVANRSTNSIALFPPTANGDPAPSATIAGSNTGLSAPAVVGLDSGGRIYVLSAQSISVFKPAAKGNASPKYFIGGGATQLSNPAGMAVDPSGDEYVTNNGSSGGYVNYYVSGDAVPERMFYDDVSAFFIPAGIALHDSTLYVADQGDESINEYPSDSNGLVGPSTVIDGISDPVEVAVAGNGQIFVSNGSEIVVYAANASGNAAPIRTISGAKTKLASPQQIFVKNDDLYVADSGANAIYVFPQSGNGDIAPTQIISGANTGLSGPQGVAVR